MRGSLLYGHRQNKLRVFYVGRVNDVHENGCGSRISVTSTLLESGTRPVFGVLAQVSTTQTSDQSASIQCPILHHL